MGKMPCSSKLVARTYTNNIYLGPDSKRKYLAGRAERDLLPFVAGYGVGRGQKYGLEFYRKE
jgi:hypothetical protein